MHLQPHTCAATCHVVTANEERLVWSVINHGIHNLCAFTPMINWVSLEYTETTRVVYTLMWVQSVPIARACIPWILLVEHEGRGYHHCSRIVNGRMSPHLLHLRWSTWNMITPNCWASLDSQQTVPCCWWSGHTRYWQEISFQEGGALQILYEWDHRSSVTNDIPIISNPNTHTDHQRWRLWIKRPLEHGARYQTVIIQQELQTVCARLHTLLSNKTTTAECKTWKTKTHTHTHMPALCSCCSTQHRVLVSRTCIQSSLPYGSILVSTGPSLTI